MKSKSKITLIVLAQIALIMGSFLSVAIWESQFSLIGNSINVAGKNRLLTSQFLSEVKDHAYVKLPDSDPDYHLKQLEENILFLKNGGENVNLKLNPLDERFHGDWEKVYSNFQLLETNYQSFKALPNDQLSPFDIYSLETDSMILISSSDNLVEKMGILIDDVSETLITIQIILLIVNVAAHVGLIYLITIIFRKEFETTLKVEKLATLGELSSRLAHDMRNPLSVMKMSTQLIKSKIPEQETAEKLDVIEKGIARMSHQIDDVMDFVRTKEPDLKLWDVKSVLEDCFSRFVLPDSVRLTLPQKSTLIKCDRAQIEILFINLISNSLDSIKNNGAIRVNVRSNEYETKIDFIDTGDGIPEDKLEEIFDPLVTFKEKGTGLGLASCKNIVNNHKGTISATNNPTTFSVILPNH